jgi:branched-chain amino acid transport system ATP-binding protein
VTPLLQAKRLAAGYGEARAIRDVDLEVEPGEVVALLGPNGAGKTTTALALAGELRPMAGKVVWQGSDHVTPLYRRAREGLALVTEERSVFMRLSTRQNLALGRDCELTRALELFPELRPLLSRTAGLLSGGEQQMLTLARALARPTRLLIADEMSLGLAPMMVTRLLTAVRAAADRGMGALIVEQHVRRALEIADRVYVLTQGKVTFAGTAAEAHERLDDIEASYLTHAPTENHRRSPTDPHAAEEESRDQD